MVVGLLTLPILPLRGSLFSLFLVTYVLYLNTGKSLRKVPCKSVKHRLHFSEVKCQSWKGWRFAKQILPDLDCRKPPNNVRWLSGTVGRTALFCFDAIPHLTPNSFPILLATHIENPAEFFAPPGFLYIFRIYLFLLYAYFFRSFPPDIPRKHRILALRFGRENPHRRIGSGRLRFGAHALVLERVFVG